MSAIGSEDLVKEKSQGVGWRQRGLALASLGCGAILAVVVVLFVVHGLGRLAMGLVGLAVTVGGGW
jgi:hypothetical protein